MSDESIHTQAVHAGEDREADHGALSVPIYTASVFALPDADEGADIHNEVKPGYYYGRLGNPTTDALERTMATLERGESALGFASGMAAISGLILTELKAGDHVVAPESMYSTAHNLLLYLAEQFGVEVTFVDATDAENYKAAIKRNTRLFWIETPSNPLLAITDVARVVEIAAAAGIRTAADNTFATPFNQRPIELGVDTVVHSATKYLGGHSDLSAGALVGSAETVKKLRKVAIKLLGGTLAPQVSWLVSRGIKTLALRMERHNANAFALANTLTDHPKIKAVYYPGLPGHKNHDIAREQMDGFGGMIGLDLETAEAARTFVNGVKLCTLATSLGGVETILQPSATMTHATVPREERLRIGISDGLIRLSVGIEDVKDLLNDILHALDTIPK